MFIKTFFDVIAKDLCNLHVIYLRRDILDTLCSFVSLKYFSPENKSWPKWMISPNAVTSAMKCLDQDENLDYIDLSIAYLIDIEARANRFAIDYPEIPLTNIKIKDLNNHFFVRNLFSKVGIKYTCATESLIGKRINQRNEVKSSFNNSLDRDYLKDRITIYLSKIQKAGLRLPNISGSEGFNFKE